MKFKEALELIAHHVGEELTKRFSGKITLVFHCRRGGIGRLSMVVDRDLSSENLVKTEKPDPGNS